MRPWAIALAVVVPGLALLGGAAPFAAPRLVVIHLLAGLPLALGLALRIAPRRTYPWVAGAGLALATFALGPLAGPALDHVEAGFTPRLLARAAWCLLLQLPWCVLARTGGSPRLAALLLGAAAAVLPPGLYASRLADTWATDVPAALGELRLEDARTRLDALVELGRTEPVAGRPPREWLAAVEKQRQALEAAVARPLPASAPPAARVERARALAVLGRHADAAALLDPLAAGDAEAALLLAAVRQKQRRFAESDGHYRAALALLGEGLGAVAARVRAYDGLAFNARAAGRPADAEAAYREGGERLPERAAHFHFQLGRHYQQAGRPGRALEHLNEAARLDLAAAAAARPYIEELRRATPGCILRTD